MERKLPQLPAESHDDESDDDVDNSELAAHIVAHIVVETLGIVPMFALRDNDFRK